MNWYTELDKAIESEPSDEKWDELNDKSLDWVTCACGQLCSKLPRDENGIPKDKELLCLGINFHDFIVHWNFLEARNTLDLIEARTSFLLSQIK